MARIRSVHPGQWTDESFATLSPLAHLLAIGLRNEADDGGVFEWRPVQIKMRLLPLYPCDVAELLAELKANDIVRDFEHGGKNFGAIRNFCRYQSPDKPRLVYPRAEWVDAYTATKGRAVADQSPTPPRLVAEEPPTVLSGKEGIGVGEDTEGNGKPAPDGAYRWRGTIVRLTEDDFDRWAKAFHAIDLPAHLETIDQWLATDAKPAQRKNWFNLVAGALRKRHEAALAEKRAGPGLKIASGYGFGLA